MTHKVINILILDIETTGLDPITDSILEIAFIPAQLSENGLNIEYGSKFTSLVKPNYQAFGMMSAKVQQMHIDSGLYHEVKTIGPKTPFDVERDILLRVEDLFGKRVNNIQLCGNSIHFDRSFLKQQMPQFERRLSYRMLDVTPYRTIRQAITSEESNNSKHRAIDDCYYSAKLLEEFYGVLCRNFTRTSPTN